PKFPRLLCLSNPFVQQLQLLSASPIAGQAYQLLARLNALAGGDQHLVDPVSRCAHHPQYAASRQQRSLGPYRRPLIPCRGINRRGGGAFRRRRPELVPLPFTAEREDSAQQRTAQ